MRPCQQWAGCNLRPILLLYWGDASPNSPGVRLYMAIFVGSEIALGQWAEMCTGRVAMLPLGIHFEYIDRRDGRTDRHRTVAIRYGHGQRNTASRNNIVVRYFQPCYVFTCVPYEIVFYCLYYWRYGRCNCVHWCQINCMQMKCK